MMDNLVLLESKDYLDHLAMLEVLDNPGVLVVLEIPVFLAQTQLIAHVHHVQQLFSIDLFRALITFINQLCLF